jgi:hypothetical protein
MNIGLPFLEQIRAAGRRQGTSAVQTPTASALTQTGTEAGGDASGTDETGFGWIALTFSQIVAAITTGYHVEHNTDDSHSTIHATGAIYERDRSVAIGDWVDAPFSASNFTGLAAMTWTVTALQQIALSYLHLGTTLYLNYWIEGAALGGTASSALKLTLPENLRVAQYASAPFYAVNGATATTGRSTATPGDRFIALFKTDNTNWSTASTVTVQGQIAIKVSDNTGDTNVLGVDPVLTYTGGSINFGANSQVAFPTAGTYTLTVNRALTVTFKGVAGGSAGATGGSSNPGVQGGSGGAGGGGGGVTTGTIVSLLPGHTYTLVVGAAGANTTLVDTTGPVNLVVLTAGTPGTGGSCTTGTNSITGGAGGSGGVDGGSNNGGAGTGPAGAPGGGGGGGSGQFITSEGAPGAGGGGNDDTRVGADGSHAGASLAGHGGHGATGLIISGITGVFGAGGGGGGGGGGDVGNAGGTGGAGQPGAALLTFVSAP